MPHIAHVPLHCLGLHTSALPHMHTYGSQCMANALYRPIAAFPPMCSLLLQSMCGIMCAHIVLCMHTAALSHLAHACLCITPPCTCMSLHCHIAHTITLLRRGRNHGSRTCRRRSTTSDCTPPSNPCRSSKAECDHMGFVIACKVIHIYLHGSSSANLMCIIL